MMPQPTPILRILSKLFIILCVVSMFMAYKMTNTSIDDLPRNENLPLFEPHISTYICDPVTLPPLDAQADAWFQESRALEDPEIYIDDRDYKQIVALTRKAAERHHWKAMLNLASFIIEGRDPPRDTEDAVQLVEKVIKLGVPAGYDRMGTYYINGTGVKTDATRAYAFWQRAAKMGSAEALSDLGRKMFSIDDRPAESRWANAAVGINMLECAYRQGYGPAAYELGYLYSNPIGHAVTKDELLRALITWHNGVKFGSAECAAAVAGEFRSIADRPTRKVDHPDMARSERYKLLARILEFYPDYRFPNLDKILPLPPAELPYWNGDRDTLLNAARGVSHPPSAPHATGSASASKGRLFLDSNYRIAPTSDITEEATAPFTGYWQPVIDENQPQQDGAGKRVDPGLYQVGERFEPVQAIRSSHAERGAPPKRWQNWRTVRHDLGNIPPPVVSGHTRQVKPPAKATACASSERCPVSGTWQPWLHTAHPMQYCVNQYWRQAWLVEGQRFSDVELDWMLDVAADDITWHLMDDAGIDICPA